jgi:hypothetical protein
VALGQSTEFACLSDGFEDGYGWEKLVRIGSDEIVDIVGDIAGASLSTNTTWMRRRASVVAIATIL